MKTKIFATVSAKLNSAPPHFSSLKFGILNPFIASIMAALLTLGLPGIVVGQDPLDISGISIFRTAGYGVENHDFSIWVIHPDDNGAQWNFQGAFTTQSCGDEIYEGTIYLLGQNSDNNTIKVLPSSENDYADYTNGVTAYDMARISAHLNSLENISCPYKIISADADGDQTIDWDDYDQLSDLILGYIDEFNRQSWEWVNPYMISLSTYGSFSTYPFRYVISDQWPGGVIFPRLTYSEVDNNQYKYFDYRSTKVGDIDKTENGGSINTWVCGAGSYPSCFNCNEKISSRSNTSNISNIKIHKGDLLEFYVVPDQNSSINGLELPVFIDDKYLEILTIETIPELNVKTNFQQKNKRLTALGLDSKLEKHNYEAQTPLLKFTLKAKSDHLHLGKIVAWDQNRNPELISFPDLLTSNDLSLILIKHTPDNFDFGQIGNTSRISFANDIQRTVSYDLFDALGNRIISGKLSLEAGYQEVNFDEQLTPGLFHLVIQKEQQILTKKIIKI